MNKTTEYEKLYIEISKIQNKNTSKFLQEYRKNPLKPDNISADKDYKLSKETGKLKLGTIIQLPGDVYCVVSDMPTINSMPCVELTMMSPYQNPATCYEFILTSFDVNIEDKEKQRSVYVLQMWNTLVLSKQHANILPRLGCLTPTAVNNMLQMYNLFANNKEPTDKTLLVQIGTRFDYKQNKSITQYIKDSNTLKINSIESLNLLKDNKKVLLYDFIKQILDKIDQSFDDIAWVFVANDKITTKEFIKLAKETYLSFRDINEIKPLQIISKSWWILAVKFEYSETLSSAQKYEFVILPKTKIGKYCKRGTVTTLKNDKKGNQNEN